MTLRAKSASSHVSRSMTAMRQSVGLLTRFGAEKGIKPAWLVRAITLLDAPNNVMESN